MGFMKKVMYKLAGINEELYNLYVEKGPCEEYAEGYKALHSKKMKPMDYTTLADIYTTLEKYDEAEEMLGHVKVGIMTDDTIKGVYLLSKLNLLLGQDKGEEAYELFKKEQKYLDIFFSAPAYRRSGMAYYDTAAVILAMNGQLQAAGYYYKLEQESSATYDNTGVYPMLTNVHMLKVMGNDITAEEAAAKAREYISNYNEFKFKWQKEQFLGMLDRYMIYSKEADSD